MWTMKQTETHEDHHLQGKDARRRRAAALPCRAGNVRSDPISTSPIQLSYRMYFMASHFLAVCSLFNIRLIQSAFHFEANPPSLTQVLFTFLQRSISHFRLLPLILSFFAFFHSTPFVVQFLMRGCFSCPLSANRFLIFMDNAYNEFQMHFLNYP